MMARTFQYDLLLFWGKDTSEKVLTCFPILWKGSIERLVRIRSTGIPGRVEALGSWGEIACGTASYGQLMISHHCVERNIVFPE